MNSVRDNLHNFTKILMNTGFEFKTENTVGKGENAGNQQFLLFLQRFPEVLSLKIVTRYRDRLTLNFIDTHFDATDRF